MRKMMAKRLQSNSIDWKVQQHAWQSDLVMCIRGCAIVGKGKQLAAPASLCVHACTLPREMCLSIARFLWDIYSCLCMLLVSGLCMLSHMHVSAQGLIYIVRKLQVELHCHDLAT